MNKIQNSWETGMDKIAAKYNEYEGISKLNELSYDNPNDQTLIGRTFLKILCDGNLTNCHKKLTVDEIKRNLFSVYLKKNLQTIARPSSPTGPTGLIDYPSLATTSTVNTTTKRAPSATALSHAQLTEDVFAPLKFLIGKPAAPFVNHLKSMLKQIHIIYFHQITYDLILKYLEEAEKQEWIRFATVSSKLKILKFVKFDCNIQSTLLKLLNIINSNSRSNLNFAKSNDLIHYWLLNDFTEKMKNKRITPFLYSFLLSHRIFVLLGFSRVKFWEKTGLNEYTLKFLLPQHVFEYKISKDDWIRFCQQYKIPLIKKKSIEIPEKCIANKCTLCFKFKGTKRYYDVELKSCREFPSSTDATNFNCNNCSTRALYTHKKFLFKFNLCKTCFEKEPDTRKSNYKKIITIHNSDHCPKHTANDCMTCAKHIMLLGSQATRTGSINSRPQLEWCPEVVRSDGKVGVCKLTNDTTCTQDCPVQPTTRNRSATPNQSLAYDNLDFIMNSGNYKLSDFEQNAVMYPQLKKDIQKSTDCGSGLYESLQDYVVDVNLIPLVYFPNEVCCVATQNMRYFYKEEIKHPLFSLQKLNKNPSKSRVFIDHQFPFLQLNRNLKHVPIEFEFQELQIEKGLFEFDLLDLIRKLNIKRELIDAYFHKLQLQSMICSYEGTHRKTFISEAKFIYCYEQRDSQFTVSKYEPIRHRAGDRLKLKEIEGLNDVTIEQLTGNSVFELDGMLLFNCYIGYGQFDLISAIKYIRANQNDPELIDIIHRNLIYNSFTRNILLLRSERINLFQQVQRNHDKFDVFKPMNGISFTVNIEYLIRTDLLVSFIEELVLYQCNIKDDLYDVKEFYDCRFIRRDVHILSCVLNFRNCVNQITYTLQGLNSIERSEFFENPQNKRDIEECFKFYFSGQENDLSSLSNELLHTLIQKYKYFESINDKGKQYVNMYTFVYIYLLFKHWNTQSQSKQYFDRFSGDQQGQSLEKLFERTYEHATFNEKLLTDFSWANDAIQGPINMQMHTLKDEIEISEKAEDELEISKETNEKNEPVNDEVKSAIIEIFNNRKDPTLNLEIFEDEFVIKMDGEKLFTANNSYLKFFKDKLESENEQVKIDLDWIVNYIENLTL